MRLIFAGTPDFAATALRALVAAGHDVVLVLTREDKPAGRGQSLAASPVKQLALEFGFPVAQPRTLRDPNAWPLLRAAAADVMVVAAYGLLLPAAVLEIPRLGCLNIHASLLPRWRGAAPIERAIEAGDTETGITIMQMDEGLDTGPMLLVERTAIAATDSGGTLRARLGTLGARLIVDALAALEGGRLVATAQPADGVTHAPRILKTEAVIDWSQPAARLVDRMRAFDPQPGTSSVLARGAGVALKFWRAQVADAAVVAPPPPGTALIAPPATLRIACGGGTALDVLELQRPGARRMGVAEFLKGFAIEAGERLAPAGD